MSWMPEKGLRRVLAFCLVCVPLMSRAQSAAWRNDWTVEAPPTLQYLLSSFQDPNVHYRQSQGPLTIGPSGDMLLRSPSFGDQILRLTSDGNVRWLLNLGTAATTYVFNGPMLPFADGSAVVATQYGNALAGIDSSGSVSWVDSIRTQLLAATSGQVAIMECKSLVVVDRGSGAVNWHYDFSDYVFTCEDSGLITDESGNLYLSYNVSTPAGNSGYEIHLLKLSSSGKLLWEHAAATTSTMRVLGIGSTNVYLTTLDNGSQVQALSADDGSLQWTNNTVSGLGMAGSPAEVIAKSSAGIQRLNEQDGTARWTQSISGSNVFISSTATTVTIGTTQLDANVGTVNWVANLPSEDSRGYPLFILGGGELGNGSTLLAQWNYTGEPPRLWTVDTDSGALLGQFSLPNSAQSPLVDNLVADPQTIAGVSILPSESGITLHARAVNSADGSLRWETTENPSPFYQFTPFVGAASADGVLATTAASGYTNRTNRYDGLWVGAFDLTSGNEKWHSLLVDPLYSQYQTYSYDPLVDPSGNVVVAYGAQVSCPSYYSYYPYTTCAQLSVVKLNAADGSVAWRHDDISAPILDDQVFPQSIWLMGSDVVVAGPFTGQYASSSLLKLSGVDGSVLWSSNIFHENAANSYLLTYPTNDGNLIVFNLFGGGWGELNGQTGATLWSNPYPTCSGSCGYYSGPVVMSDGSLLFAESKGLRLYTELLPAQANSSPIHVLLGQADANATQTVPGRLNRDSEGGFWLTCRKFYPFGAKVDYLAKFDPTTGDMTSQQALRLESRDPLVPWTYAIQFQAPENGRMLTYVSDYFPPSMTAEGSAAIDTSITANGNLALNFTTDPIVPRTGDTVDFHLTANYTGDAPITGARMIADFPWLGRASDVNCATQNAGNCMLDQRATTLVVSFDVQPGGHVDVTGRIQDTGSSDSSVPMAIATGPIGLNESDTTDNSARANQSEVIFVSGFE